MPIFVKVCEEAIFRPKQERLKVDVAPSELREELETLQKKGAKILDVKVSMCNLRDDVFRAYLIIYEAQYEI